MTGTIYAIGVLTALACVMAPGWALQEIANSMGFRFRKTGASSFLTPFAFGVHLNAVWFLCAWIVYPGALKPHLLPATFVLDLALTTAGLAVRYRSRTHSGNLSRTSMRFVVPVLIGLVIGSFACIQIPSVLDSIQIRQILGFVAGWGWSDVDRGTVLPFARALGLLSGSIPCPPMPGFAGIMLVPSLLLSSLPVTTVGAGMKVLLVVVAAFSVTHLTERLGLRPRLLVSLVAIAGLIFSRFGLYGMLGLGKDSIFAVPMLVASMASLVGDKGGRQQHEAGLYFSAAIFLGSVVVPYGLVFWAIYSTLSLGRRRLLPDLASLLAWTTLALPVAIAGIHTSLDGGGHHLSLGEMIGMQLVAAIILGLWSRRARSESADQSRSWLAPLSPLVPMMAFGTCFLLMPATAHIVTWVDAFGKPVTEERSPLDGQTSFYRYFFHTYDENLTALMLLAVAGCVFLPFAKRRYRSPGYIALFAFLPVTLVLVLAHLKLGLHSLTTFNIWDITKNVPQWFVGTLFAPFAILAVSVLTGPVVNVAKWRRPNNVGSASRLSAIIVALVIVVGIGHRAFRDALHSDVAIPATVTSTGGYSDPGIAQAMDFVWANARGQSIFISPGSTFMGGFYLYQMYGASNTFQFSKDLLNQSFARTYPRATFLLDVADIPEVVAFSRELNASVSGRELSNHQYMLSVTFDGAGRVTATGLGDSFATLDQSAYGEEQVNGQAFRWAGKELDLTVSAPLARGDVCIDIQLLDPSAETRTVVLTSSKSTVSVSISARNTFGSALPVAICTPIERGRGVVHLSVSGSDRPFPGDPRKVAVGIIWPPQFRLSGNLGQ
jgi:hypothetical protein